METLNASEAQRYAKFTAWTPYEAALLLAGCKPQPRGHIPDPKGDTPAFNLIQAVLHCGPSKNLDTPHPPAVWMRWYSEYLAGYDFPEFSQTVMQAIAPTQTATPAPVVAASDGPAPLTTAPAWSLKKPKRFQGYGKPLFDFVKVARIAGQPIPKARDLLDAWKTNRPPDVFEVTDNGLKYYDAKGNTKPADLEAIRKAIGRMINKRPTTGR